jgi:hypothetical protein
VRPIPVQSCQKLSCDLDILPRKFTERNQGFLLDLANNFLHRPFIVKLSGLSHERGLNGKQAGAGEAYWSPSKDEGIGPGREGGASAIVSTGKTIAGVQNR